MREPDLLHTALTERLDGIVILHYAFFILHSYKFPFILLSNLHYFKKYITSKYLWKGKIYERISKIYKTVFPRGNVLGLDEKNVSGKSTDLVQC